MPQIAALETAAAEPTAQALLNAVQSKLGLTPNLYRSVAHSPASLQAVLGMGEALSKGVLSGRFGEQIALVVAEANSCDYCLSAHTAIAGMMRLTPEEIAHNRQAQSSDPKAAAGLEFARALVRTRGHVSEEAFESVRASGYTDAAITEIIAHVALNTFTNYFNSAVQTDIDFPRVHSSQLVSN